MSKGQTRKNKIVEQASLFTGYDIYLFKQGNHSYLYEKFGSHPMTVEEVEGTYFAVWAPNAEHVSVVGDFNNWNTQSHLLIVRGDHSGIWEGFIAGVRPGSIYKYHIASRYNGYEINKGDPFAFSWELPPRTASVVTDLQYHWADRAWMENRHKSNSMDAPISIYEMHFGSWKRVIEEGNRSLNYREMAHHLADYVKKMGFTHIELMPIMEHPFYGSWGYQITGFFAPTQRYGTPQDFMYLMDYLHQQGIGVILDWVPSHFPSDEHGLAFFDGTHLYEHADPQKGFHPEWSSYIFNYGRNEIRSFLLSNAFFWLQKYHADGLRVDAVSSMLYLDYARKEGQWIPNEYGGRENIEAIHFLKRLNESIYETFPDVQTIAEESTAWPMVTRPTYTGGLGFKMKWMMGWMHDNILYFQQDPINRKHHHNLLTFSLWYAFTENYVLPLSHDEVVYGKGSMLGKMHGDEWQRFANLRLLYGFMYGHPGKKLLFMGAEFGQVPEWEHEKSLEWDVLQYPFHQGVQRWVQDLNRLYQAEPALHELDFNPEGFEWIDMQDWEQSIISFIRKGKTTHEVIMAVMNCTSVPRYEYRIGASRDGVWKEVMNSDASSYGGSGLGNLGRVEALPIPCHGRPYSVQMTLPPLSITFLKNDSTS